MCLNSLVRYHLHTKRCQYVQLVASYGGPLSWPSSFVVTSKSICRKTWGFWTPDNSLSLKLAIINQPCPTHEHNRQVASYTFSLLGWLLAQFVVSTVFQTPAINSEANSTIVPLQEYILSLCLRLNWKLSHGYWYIGMLSLIVTHQSSCLILFCMYYNGSVCSTQIFQPNFQEWSIRAPTHFTLTSQEPPLISLRWKEPHLLLLSTNKAAFQRYSCDGRCNIAEILWWIIIDYQTAWIKGTKFMLGKASRGCKVSTCRYNFQ